MRQPYNWGTGLSGEKDEKLDNRAKVNDTEWRTWKFVLFFQSPEEAQPKNPYNHTVVNNCLLPDPYVSLDRCLSLVQNITVTRWQHYAAWFPSRGIWHSLYYHPRGRLFTKREPKVENRSLTSVLFPNPGIEVSIMD